jgi:peptidoglycan/LPS O-acetylase OafA/YrhL
MSNQLDGRLIPLEALRGMAAFIVLVHHFFFGVFSAHHRFARCGA